MVALKVTDIALQEASLQMRIQTSKTDPFRKGSTIHLTPSGDPVLCPVAAFRLFLEGHSRQGALFCFANGARLSKCRLTQLVKVLAGRSGVDPASYASHSFRIGAATMAAAAGVPDRKIKALGRWLSDAYQVLAGRSGVDPASYASHSFRIGAATMAAAAGVPDWKIKALGRWLSDAYHAYICVPDDQLLAIPALLARSTI